VNEKVLMKAWKHLILNELASKQNILWLTRYKTCVYIFNFIFIIIYEDTAYQTGIGMAEGFWNWPKGGNAYFLFFMFKFLSWNEYYVGI